MKDVDMDNNILHVINAKNNKDRDVPVSCSVMSYIKWYGRKIHPAYVPVSYTHLDVYKRQVVILARMNHRAFMINVIVILQWLQMFALEILILKNCFRICQT